MKRKILNVKLILLFETFICDLLLVTKSIFNLHATNCTQFICVLHYYKYYSYIMVDDIIVHALAHLYAYVVGRFILVGLRYTNVCKTEKTLNGAVLYQVPAIRGPRNT